MRGRDATAGGRPAARKGLNSVGYTFYERAAAGFIYASAPIATRLAFKKNMMRVTSMNKFLIMAAML
ncbi:MAG: hypothetical protein ACJAWZ_004091 [Paracoccaceae bacterium]